MSSYNFKYSSSRNETIGRKNIGNSQSTNKNDGNSQLDIFKSRDVFPEYTEPNDYTTGFPVPCSSKAPQHWFNRQTEKSPYSRPGNSMEFSRTGVQPKSGYRPLPLFRQYLQEEDEDLDKENDYFVAVSSPRSSDSSIVYQQDAKTGFSNEKSMSAYQRPTNKTNFTFQDSHQSSNKEKNSQEPKGFIGTRTRHLIGSVDQVIRWHKISKNSELELHFEVIGMVESTLKKNSTQLIFIKSDRGQTLQGVFYTIDRELPKFSSGTLISATGNMIGSNKLHIFDAVQINPEDLPYVQRLAFLSQRSLQDALQN